RPMTALNKQALREVANAANIASWGKWESYKPHKGARGYEVKVGAKAVAQHCLKVDSAFIAAANPSTVLALLDELEEKYDALKSSGKRESAARRRIDELLAENDAAESRIAELEAREVAVKQFDDFQIVHYGGSEDYAKGYIDCQNNYNKALTTAGIGVKGE
ncbi:ead/Ea22-like family protein, partial [Citrobacter freundii]